MCTSYILRDITLKTTILARQFIENVTNEDRVGVSDKGIVFRALMKGKSGLWRLKMEYKCGTQNKTLKIFKNFLVSGVYENLNTSLNSGTYAILFHNTLVEKQGTRIIYVIIRILSLKNKDQFLKFGPLAF